MKFQGILTGLVAFFDILGYKAINENNEIEVVAQVISDVLLRLPDRVKRSQNQIWEKICQILEASPFNIDRYVSVLLFSDSILLTAPATKDAGPDDEGELLIWLLFVSYCRELWIEMFKEGLPVKGAIGYGKFFRNKDCFAGKAILDAYNLTTKMELSACALTAESESRFNELIANSSRNFEKLIMAFLFEYPIPLKVDQIEKHLVLKSPTEGFTGDVRQLVFDSFLAHNKPLLESTKLKAENTEILLRSMISRKKQVQNS
jgi:hypothetical protein